LSTYIPGLSNLSFYHSVQNYLSSCLLSENLNIKVGIQYYNEIMPFTSMGVELGLTLKEGYALMVFENTVMRIRFGPKTEEMAGG